MAIEELNQEEHRAVYISIARLFDELNLKHEKGEGEILLQYQDNTIFVLEQEYGDLMILREIPLNGV